MFRLWYSDANDACHFKQKNKHEQQRCYVVHFNRSVGDILFSCFWSSRLTKVAIYGDAPREKKRLKTDDYNSVL